jgi:hypothetical protein
MSNENIEILEYTVEFERIFNIADDNMDETWSDIDVDAMVEFEDQSK